MNGDSQARQSRITSVPLTYAGVRFRSTLEADWAATLDSLGIVWQYEPEAVQLPSGTLYRPDFYLPEIATWLEVKGPHDERLEKTRELAAAVCSEPGSGNDEYPFSGYQLVVIGRAPVRGIVTWELVGSEGDAELVKCRKCGAWWWYDWAGAFGCRKHRRHQGGDDDLGDTGDDLPFVRAPRDGQSVRRAS
jgi:hypothetical protein